MLRRATAGATAGSRETMRWACFAMLGSLPRAPRALEMDLYGWTNDPDGAGPLLTDAITVHVKLASDEASPPPSRTLARDEASVETDSEEGVALVPTPKKRARHRYALLHVDGALAFELPNKPWAVAYEPPCGSDRSSVRWTSANIPVARSGRVDVRVDSLDCDRSILATVSGAVDVVVDARDVAGCEDVRGEDVEVVDAFMAFNEWDLVETRLIELAGLVDAHLLVESDKTHFGGERMIRYADAADRVSKNAANATNGRAARVFSYLLKQKPATTRISDDPDVFDYGRPARDCVADALKDPRLRNLGPDALVLFGDADEVPSRSVVERLRLAAASGWPSGVSRRDLLDPSIGSAGPRLPSHQRCKKRIFEDPTGATRADPASRASSGRPRRSR